MGFNDEGEPRQFKRFLIQHGAVLRDHGAWIYQISRKYTLQRQPDVGKETAISSPFPSGSFVELAPD